MQARLDPTDSSSSITDSMDNNDEFEDIFMTNNNNFEESYSNLPLYAQPNNYKTNNNNHAPPIAYQQNYQVYSQYDQQAQFVQSMQYAPPTQQPPIMNDSDLPPAYQTPDYFEGNSLPTYEQAMETCYYCPSYVQTFTIHQYPLLSTQNVHQYEYYQVEPNNCQLPSIYENEEEKQEIQTKPIETNQERPKKGKTNMKFPTYRLPPIPNEPPAIKEGPKANSLILLRRQGAMTKLPDFGNQTNEEKQKQNLPTTKESESTVCIVKLIFFLFFFNFFFSLFSQNELDLQV